MPVGYNKTMVTTERERERESTLRDRHGQADRRTVKKRHTHRETQKKTERQIEREGVEKEREGEREKQKSYREDGRKENKREATLRSFVAWTGK